MQLWNDLIKVLQIEKEYLDKLRENLLKEQSLVILNQPVVLKEVLEEQKDIMHKNFQIEQHRMKVLKQLEDEGKIPSSELNIKQLYNFIPMSLRGEMKEIDNRMKVLVFEINELNKRNQMLLNNAINLIDEEIRLFTMDHEKALYHKNGELLEKQKMSILNKKV